ncbi:MAG TPA: pyridoxal-dependent decarboxylase [Acidimicrobiia bacterium]|nr:pyridoxal-dependent decarboxylase [Acidimicrobiia bacterium]
MHDDTGDLLRHTADLAIEHLATIAERPVHATATADELRAVLGGPLNDEPRDARTVVDDLARAAAPGLVASAGPRYFGFVVGGTLPATVAADWLTSAWDQNSGLLALSLANGVVEETVGRWLVELFGLPEGTSCGFVTGGQMANFTCLAAARNHVLARAGHDVEAEGLHDAPRLRVIGGAQRHVTIDAALRLLGIGTSIVEGVEIDDQGRMLPDALAATLAQGDPDAPTIVNLQAGNVNSGAFDPFTEICAVAHEHARNVWVHVDGAFGLWARASAQHRALADGIERADSWSTDAHKWLNVPYDSGLAFVRHADAHVAAMRSTAAYLANATGDDPIDPYMLTPEFSRRARGFAVYAALRNLGTRGVEDLVDRTCAHARRFATALGDAPGVEILNDVVLNQVLVRFGDDDDHTRAVIDGVQRDGTCWLGGTTWRGQAAMRISVSNWSTTAADVDRSVAAILRIHTAAQGR